MDDIPLTCRKCNQPKDRSGFYTKKGKPDLSWCKQCYRDWYLGRNGGTITKSCTWCSASYEVVAARRRANQTRSYCSRACKDAHRKQEAKDARLATKVERPCIWCGATMPPTKRVDASFCSEQCNSAAHQITRKIAKRAARYRGEDVPKRDNLVTREEIARRDNYRCQLCGGAVNMDLRHPDPMAPSIDHIVPLAHHGGNGDHNLQLAHLRCNLSKRAGVKPAVVQPQLCPNL